MDNLNYSLIDKFLFLFTALCLLAFPIAILGFRLELWAFGLSFKLVQLAFFTGVVLFLLGAFMLIKSLVGLYSS